MKAMKTLGPVMPVIVAVIPKMPAPITRPVIIATVSNNPTFLCKTSGFFSAKFNLLNN